MRPARKNRIMQGVPKIGSSNFMRRKFWSKLYLYMNFLKDQKFSSHHAPFVLFITFC